VVWGGDRNGDAAFGEAVQASNLAQRRTATGAHNMGNRLASMLESTHGGWMV